MKGSMRQRTNGAWELRVYVGRDPLTGTRCYVSRTVRGSGREAESALARLVTESLDQVHPATASTVGDLLEAWYDHFVEDWSPTTASNYRSLIDRRLLPAFGATKLAKLQTRDIDRFYVALHRRGGVDGGPLSAASVRRVHAVLHRALNQAVKWGHLTSNPASRASPPTERRRNLRIPTVEDLQDLFEAAELVNPQLPLFLRLAATTGARRGELVALRWRHLDAAQALLTIERSVVVGLDRYLVEKDTKTHQSRRVHLAGGTSDALVSMRSSREARCDELRRDLAGFESLVVSPDHFMFSHDHAGEHPWRPDYVSLAFSRLRTQLGLDSIRFHDLRHFTATALLTGGLDVRTVSGRLGHASSATTLNVYAHFLSGPDREAAEHMGKLFGDP
jgi:integrase